MTNLQAAGMMIVGWKALLQFPVTIVNVDMPLAYKAASIKAKYKLSFANAYAAILAISRNAGLK